MMLASKIEHRHAHGLISGLPESLGLQYLTVSTGQAMWPIYQNLNQALYQAMLLIHQNLNQTLY